MRGANSISRPNGEMDNDQTYDRNHGGTAPARGATGRAFGGAATTS